MPRTTTPTQPIRPTSAPARTARTLARPTGFKPSAPPVARRAALSVPAVNFTPSGSMRMTTPPASSQVSVNPIVGSTTASATSCCCVACTGLQCLDRTRFFSGQLLTDADLNNEQSYMLAKNRLHNRYLNGWGVVCGLQVTCSECDGYVTINPGYAIDPCGNDVIVCSAQSFNVLQAIQVCCTPQTQTPNCQPLRYTPPPTCLDMPQKWCITVQYQEQPSQMVTPLQPVTSTNCSCGNGQKSCTCGCGGSASNSHGCGCGCGGGSSTSSSCASSVSSATAACQPTRIIEGFQFGVCQLPSAETKGAVAGTMEYQFQQCSKNLDQLVLQAPNNLDTMWNNNNQQGVYQAVCSYVVTVQQYFAQNSTLTDCSVLTDLNNISVPTLASGAQLADYQAIRNEVLLILFSAWFNCFCLAVVPQCPPPACDSRVPLACVTIQNGVIQEICHFECRKQLIGTAALNYWFEPLFNSFSAIISDVAERYCCGGAAQRDPNQYFPSTNAYDTENVTTTGITNGAVLNRVISSFVAQRMGAGMVNMANPLLRAVDLRPYVGQTLDDDTKARLSKQFSLDVQTADSSWDAAAVAAGSQLAPAAVSIGQPVTVYVKNNLIVGMEVTNPTRSLELQVQSLSTQVSTLQTQLSNLQTQNPPQSPASPAKPADASPGIKGGKKK